MKYLTRDASHDNLVLPDGRAAKNIRLLPLLAELQRLRIPGITPEMGKEALLKAFGEHVTAVVEKMPRADKHPRPLSEAVARQAVRLIEQQAAGIGSSGPAAPSASIASMRL
jgi:hypothetical protein